MASDLRERARQFIEDWYKAKGPGDHEWHHVAAEFAAAVRAEAGSAQQRLYDALSAMMYGWADDGVRVAAFAALKEAEPFIESAPTWDAAEAALTRHARLDSTSDEVKAAFHIAVNWLAANKPRGS